MDKTVFDIKDLNGFHMFFPRLRFVLSGSMPALASHPDRLP